MVKERVLLCCVCFFLASSFAFFSAPASAFILSSVDFKGVHEDNITASAADVGKKGDFYGVVSATLGSYRGVGGDYTLFLRGDAAGYLYRRYSDLDAFVAGITPGAYREFGDRVTAAISTFLQRKTFREEERSSTSYGAALEIRQYLLPKTSVDEFYSFERNNAGSGVFSYNGHLLGIRARYLLTPGMTAGLGYSYLVRKYDEPAGFTNEYRTASLEIVTEIAERVFLTGAYSRQHHNANSPEMNHVNNMVVFGTRYEF